MRVSTAFVTLPWVAAANVPPRNPVPGRQRELVCAREHVGSRQRCRRRGAQIARPCRDCRVGGVAG